MFELGRFNLNGEVLDSNNKFLSGDESSNPCVMQRVTMSPFFDVVRVGTVLTISFINGATVPFEVVDMGWDMFALKIRERTIVRIAENDRIILKSRFGVTQTDANFVLETEQSKFCINVNCEVNGGLRLSEGEKQIFTAFEMQDWRFSCGVHAPKGVSVFPNGVFTTGGCSYKNVGDYSIFKFPNGLSFFLKDCPGVGTLLGKRMIGIEISKCKSVFLRVKSVNSDVYVFRILFNTFQGVFTTRDIRYGFDFFEYLSECLDTSYFTKTLIFLG